MGPVGRRGVGGSREVLGCKFPTGTVSSLEPMDGVVESFTGQVRKTRTRTVQQFIKHRIQDKHNYQSPFLFVFIGRGNGASRGPGRVSLDTENQERRGLVGTAGPSTLSLRVVGVSLSLRRDRYSFLPPAVGGPRAAQGLSSLSFERWIVERRSCQSCSHQTWVS